MYFVFDIRRSFQFKGMGSSRLGSMGSGKGQQKQTNKKEMGKAARLKGVETMRRQLEQNHATVRQTDRILKRALLHLFYRSTHWTEQADERAQWNDYEISAVDGENWCSTVQHRDQFMRIHAISIFLTLPRRISNTFNQLWPGLGTWLAHRVRQLQGSSKVIEGGG